MHKKQFVALADCLREHNGNMRRIFASPDRMMFNAEQIGVLADFCQSQNPRFDRERWLGYIAGEVGPNGGKR